MGNCSVCDKRISVFYCNVTRGFICNYCCDKYQLNQRTEGWDRYFGNKYKDFRFQDVTHSYQDCLDCKGLCRVDNYEVFTKPENGFGMSFISFNHNGKYIFTSNPDHIFVKRKAFLEKMQCVTVEDYYYLAETYYFLREYDKSIKLLTEAIGKYENTDLFLLLGKSYYNNGDVEKALPKYKKSLFLSESNPETHRCMADLLLSIKDYEGSVYFYNQSLEKMSFEDGYINDSFFYYNYFGLAIAYSKINQYEKVIEVANDFLDLSISDWDNFMDRVTRVRNDRVNDFNLESDIYATSTIYEILSLAYIELDNLELAEEYISRAKWIGSNNINLARMEGIIIGKRSNDQKVREYKEIFDELVKDVEQRMFDKMREFINSNEGLKNEDDELNEELPTRFLELKPNFMGIGLNLNKILEEFFKKK
ncbi:tetratricopeptide repeat protein [Alkalicoccobacillus plakortidis]|uniref:Tetratricopeptide repeat protein n=1 Tax=Alkalicoccobacillus plakortidis TaxID=444060 RepID=A0ABT0XHD2_9BACI|nr:tetratricopeptide repeat protein [Alkalicoccobacillus plakortidis]MCM2675302.1 hypothetical protein [Alkalicoccobacillus plakortidis]